MLARFFISLSLSFLIAIVLTPVTGVFWLWLWPYQQGFLPQEQLFLFFLVGCANKNWVPFDNNDVLAGRFWENLFFSKCLEFLSFFLVGRWSQENQKSISLVPDRAWRLVLVSASTVLSTSSSQKSNCLSLTSN